MGKIFDVNYVFDAIAELIKFLPMTLQITVLSMFFGLILGLLLAIIKIDRVPVLSQLTTIFVSFVRGTPLIVQLYLSYTGIPLLLKYYNLHHGTDLNVNDVPALLFVLVTFSLNEAGYNSESLRAALLSVDRGQIEAAQSLGMTYGQVMKRVILPEAFVVALPTLGNTLIGLLKGTSLAFVCAVVEMTAQAKILAGSNFRYFEVYLALALIYWVVTIIIEQLIRMIEKKIAVPDEVVLRSKRSGDWL